MPFRLIFFHIKIKTKFTKIYILFIMIFFREWIEISSTASIISNKYCLYSSYLCCFLMRCQSGFIHTLVLVVMEKDYYYWYLIIFQVFLFHHLALLFHLYLSFVSSERFFNHIPRSESSIHNYTH